jgi:hypothetical protein
VSGAKETTLFVWQERDSDGEWGIIAAAVVPDLGVTPLVTRSRALAMNQFAVVAEQHHQEPKRTVRLARYDYGSELGRYDA